MAKPIETTPTLTGKNAQTFLDHMYGPVQPVSAENYEACRAAYQMMQQMAL